MDLLVKELGRSDKNWQSKDITWLLISSHPLRKSCQITNLGYDIINLDPRIHTGSPNFIYCCTVVSVDPTVWSQWFKCPKLAFKSAKCFIEEVEHFVGKMRLFHHFFHFTIELHNFWRHICILLRLMQCSNKAKNLGTPRLYPFSHFFICWHKLLTSTV